MEMSVFSNYSNEAQAQKENSRGHNVDNTQLVGFNREFGNRKLLASDLSYDDRGPHREMAIDCPVTFVGARKETPRYPAPLGVIQNSASGIPKGSFSSVTSKTSGYYVGRSSGPESSSISRRQMEDEQMERIRYYQEELAKRREMEEKFNREQEFLRTSLRGSKKLQELEERRAKGLSVNATGIDNPTYLVDDDETSRNVFCGTDRLMHDSYIGSLPLGVKDIVSSVEQAKRYLQHPDDQRELQLISDFVLREQFQKLLRVHNKIVEAELGRKLSSPVTDEAQVLLQNSLQSLSSSHINDPAITELAHLLRKPHLKSLLFTHDQCVVLKREPLVQVTAEEDDEREYLYERASEYGEDSIKIVRIQKTADPLGATVRNEGESVIIGRIVKGGAADKSGLLHEGDEILEINGTDVRGKTIGEVCDFMSMLTGVLTFLINPRPDHRPLQPRQQTIVHIRAHYDYDPEDDLYIPCRELGISFEKGDILHVINQDDLNWWQAYREGEDDQSLAGLIPSKAFQEQREALKQLIVNDTKENSKKKHRCNCGHRRQKKQKKLYSISGEELEANEILTYEEVALYYPQPNRKRPIVLIGPPNVGRQELRLRLMESDPERFAAAVPHTSRPRKDEEADGREYYFVPRDAFESDIAENRFVEYGEYEKHLFGTSMDAIRQVVNSGKICILNFHPQALRILKASDLKPYFVFVAPPNIEKLKQLRQKQGVRVTDDELKTIIEKAREMEETYSHYFDMIIVNQDLDRAYEELLAEINRLELEPQWVPLQWVSSAGPGNGNVRIT